MLQYNSLELVEGQANQEDNEQMVSIPEHLEIRPPVERQIHIKFLNFSGS